MIICHIGKMGSIKKEGIITQNIYKHCKGKHKYHSVYKHSTTPKADIYILHCFRNDWEYFEKWFIPWHEESKIISLIHSYEPCKPNYNSDKVVTITETWQKHLQKKGIESIMIYPGIDLKPFYKTRPNLKDKVFGKISRAEKGKFHNQWEKILKSLLKSPDIKYRLICNNYKKLGHLKTNKTKYIEGVKINQVKKKIKELCKLSVYADAHGDFIETFSLGLLEAMACGLPIVLYTKGQDAMSEVLDSAGVKCNNIKDFETQVYNVLNYKSGKEFYSKLSRQRAGFFSLEKFVKKWDGLIDEVSNN